MIEIRYKDLGIIFKEYINNRIKLRDNIQKMKGYRVVKFNDSKDNNSNRYNPYKRENIVYFYEWSDLGNIGKRYTDIDQLLKDLRKWGVEYSSTQETELRSAPLSYCVCMNGSNKLLISHTYNNLKKSLNNIII